MKHPISKSIAAFLFVGVTTVCLPDSSPAVDPVCGDVNGSGDLTTSDALSVLRKSVGQSLLLQCPAFAAPLETGQTLCYDVAGVVIDCNGTAEDGELRSGVARSFTDNGDGTITDHASGLMWEKLSNDGGIHDRDQASSWENAFARTATLNSQNFAGYGDWHLPNQFELYSLVNLGPGTVTTWPAFNTACPPGCTVLQCNCIGAEHPTAYWSSTTYLNGTQGSGAWIVLFDGGFTAAADKTFSAYSRAVRNP